MKKMKIISTICIVLTLCISLVAVSYAWLKREWTPGAYGTDIKVQASTTLAIQFGDDAPTQNLDLLNDIINLNKQFELKQVSNFTGLSDDFFGLAFEGEGVELPDATIKHLDSKDENGLSAAYDNGYIEKEFLIISGKDVSEGQIQYVYLDSSSYIGLAENIPEGKEVIYQKLFNSIRISITSITEDGGEDTVGIKLQGDDVPHTGINPQKDDNGAYLAVGKPVAMKNEDGDIIPSDDHKKIVSTEGVDAIFNELSYYTDNGGRALFKMNSSEQVKTTVRIWLEGTAAGCDNDIAGLDLDICIKFAAKIIDKPAEKSATENVGVSETGGEG